MLWGNMAYCVELSGEDLAHYLNKIESVGLRKCPTITVTIRNISYSLPHIMAGKQATWIWHEEITSLSRYV